MVQPGLSKRASYTSPFQKSFRRMGPSMVFHVGSLVTLAVLPAKPVQVEPKVYEVGEVNANSPLLVTTNFSLSYYSVESEVEASRIPCYIISVDTEGTSVLTAWAADKFNPETITDAIKKCLWVSEM